MRFPSNIHKELKNYIYAYYDPTDGNDLPFYIGRGIGNRAFSHLKDSHNPEVQKILDKLNDLGTKPLIKIIIHGLNANQAKIAETAAIALLGKDNLANLVKGSRSKFTNASPREIVDHYNAKDVTIKHKVIMIIRNPWNPDLPEYEHYDRTRSAWRLGSKKDLAQYAFLVHQGIVKRIYTVTAWYPDGSTFHSRNNPDPNNPFYRKDYRLRDRFEFVGRLLDQNDEISKKYLGKSIKRYIRATGSPCHYSYNKEGDVYKFNQSGKIINP